MEEIFRLEQVYFTYPTEKNPAIRNISLQIHSGEFLVLCGDSGCGKTTLLKQLKPELAPHGRMSGRIMYHGKELAQVNPRESAAGIGYVGQNPEDGIVTDKVWHELAFGLESLGLDSQIIRKRVAEMSQFFGIQSWFHQSTDSLSGGQKQLLNLASVMVMKPDILLLDEPTSQMDPVAAAEFLTMLGRIHRELGTTILMTEHRLEEVLSYSTRMVMLESGAICLDSTPREIACRTEADSGRMSRVMPAPVRIWQALETAQTGCPLSVAEGRSWFEEYWKQREATVPVIQTDTKQNATVPCRNREVLVRVESLSFCYEKHGREILRNLSLDIAKGELLAIMGGNGSGKSTLLTLLAGMKLAQRGRIVYSDKEQPRPVLLPQNPQLLFSEETVQKELEDMLSGKQPEERKHIQRLVKLCRLEGLLLRHPYDLSGGEQQRLALAKVLMTRPQLLLMDEPTKGLDAGFKKIFAEILTELQAQGCTVVLVSHDVEFCAEYAERCVLMFDGQVVSDGEPKEFFSENHFYTTTTNRMVRQYLPKAITVADVLQICGGYEGEDTAHPGEAVTIEKKDEEPEPVRTDKLRTRVRKHPRFIWSAFLLIPVTIYVGMQVLDNQKYLFIALLVLLESMLPFFFSFEGKKPQASKLVLLSVLCAIGVAGRVVFSMLPQFKPVTAVTIIAGVVFGGEAGFLVGALTMLISNMLFGQGPWTAWQMAAMGVIGLLAGILFSGNKRPGTVWLCVYGFLAAVIIYGGIMNPASALMAGIPVDWDVLLLYWGSGLPLDVVHGVSTVLFLAVGASPLIKKLERAKVKFGL